MFRAIVLERFEQIAEARRIHAVVKRGKAEQSGKRGENAEELDEN